MDSTKYIGMDVHKETVTIAVRNSAGKLVVESILIGSDISRFSRGTLGVKRGDDAAIEFS
jgi:hypothetical protein